MSVEARLRQAEGAARHIRAPEPDYSPRDWLGFYGQWQKEGRFDGEPDFARALAEFKEAIDRQDATRPSSVVRRIAEDVLAGWAWLECMQKRAVAGLPGLTLTDVAQLVEWFRANADRIPRDPQKPCLIPMDGGYVAADANLLAFHDEPKGDWCQDAAVIMRRLKERAEGRTEDPAFIAWLEQGHPVCHKADVPQRA